MYLLFGIIIITALFTYKGLNDNIFLSKNIFDVERIRQSKETSRILSSGFLHADWMHFGFNMLTLYFFAPIILSSLGSLSFVLLYFLAMIGGNLLALLVHRNNFYYRAYGASGAVSGILLASIMMNPTGIHIYGIIPGWLFAIGYILASIYGSMKQSGNIGHSAHLGGAIIGLLYVAVAAPYQVNRFPIIFFSMMIPSIAFILHESGIIDLAKLGAYPFKKKKFKDLHHRGKDVNPKFEKDQELNALLEKINRTGFHSLTDREKERLEELSK